MNKKFLSAILFGALMVTSTGTFVSCKDYDDDIENLTNDLAAQKSQLEQQIAALESQMSSLDAATKAQLEQLKKDLAAANAEQLAKIQAALDEMKRNLTSLVFVPEFYYGGIEAMTVKTYNYQSWTTEAVSADADNSKDAPVEGAQVEMAPKLTASYHVNPSTVTTEDILSVKFLAADKKYESVVEARSVEDVVVFGEATAVVKNGILNVSAPVKDGSIKMEGDVVTVLAAQAILNQEGKEVTVTSDYAVVRSEVRTGFDLAIATLETEEAIHLYGSAAEAIADEKNIRLQLVWNAEGFDIADTIRTHINDCAKNLDAKANDGVAESQGFEYSYELVGWFSGDNKTSESAHAALNGSVIRPQMTADGKQQAFGAEQSKATIGRLPVVRVILTDVISGNVAAVGYLPFEIVAEAPVEKQWEVAYVAPFAFDEAFTLGCEEEATKLALKWNQVEEQIIAKLGLSKAEFHEMYVLEDAYLGDDYNVCQFSDVTVDATKLAAADKIGYVTMPTNDNEADQTKILTWSIAHNDAYQIFKAGEESIQVNVRYVNETEMKYVYVTLTWTPKELNIAPAGDILDADKIDEYWYAHDSAEAGFADIHANVEVVGTADADCEFKTDMLNTFVGNKLTVANIDEVYVDFQDELLTKTFVFDAEQEPNGVLGVSGTTYYLAPNKAGNILLAYTSEEDREAATGYQLVAKIEGSKIIYQETKWAKDILNYADHKELAEGETFTAKLAITAGTCEEVALTNNKFYVKFLRPISVSDPGETNFEDAETKGSEVALVLDFVDWREHDFNDEEATKGEDYYAYYAIESIEADMDNVTTTMDGGTLGETLLSSKTTKLEFDFVAPEGAITKDNMGVLKYTNNESTVKPFKIQVPLTITYKWGQIKTYVTCNVGKTIEN